MTVKERENLQFAYSSILATISELSYYDKAGWLKDKTALNHAENTKHYIRKILFKK